FFSTATQLDIRILKYSFFSIAEFGLKNIINPNKDDENVFLTYTLDIPQIIEIQNKSNVFFEIDNEKFIYMFSQYSS
ncbi:MAG: hypothetical protein ACK40Y_03945, partial [Cloacibacterium caeni]